MIIFKQKKDDQNEQLVGGFKHDFYFPFHIWDVILPIDELIFFKMVIAPPTSCCLKIVSFGGNRFTVDDSKSGPEPTTFFQHRSPPFLLT
jgi:hypothetical protein